MAKKILVFQHNPWEGPGQFLLNAVKYHRIKLDIIRVWEEPIPVISGYRAMIVLGGGPNVDQEHIFPFLIEEKKVIKKAISMDIPYLGFCLGHQLLANILGAKVGPNFQSSIGFVKGFLTHNGKKHPLFAGLPQGITLFKWHSQSVQEPLPTSMNILATSTECQVEAISLEDRPHIIGLQFDNHAATPAEVKNWLAMDSKWICSLTDREVEPAAILADAKRESDLIGKQFAKLFDNFLSLIQ